MYSSNMQTLIVQPKDPKELDAVKAALKALDVSFKMKEVEPYDPEFVAKIERSRQEVKGGKFSRVKEEALQTFLGLK
ncbi:hypothetical protein ABIE26_002823 [Pedobacter africanus]